MKDTFYTKDFTKPHDSDVRLQNIFKHTFLSFLLKGGGIVINLLLVPLSINYLGVENYGVWVTVSSVITWLIFFDIGLGHGLRNKFSEALANGEKQLAKEFVSAAYTAMVIISAFIMMLTLVLNQFVDWSILFNVNDNLVSEINILLPIILGFFSLQLVFKLVVAVYYGAQKHSIQNLILFLGQLLSLIIIYILIEISSPSLLYLGVILSALPLILLILLNLIAFNGEFKEYRPSYTLSSLKRTKEVIAMGSKFFIIQISVLVLFSTDNIIISQLFSPAEVVPYEISRKYFSLVIHLFFIIVNPYWSSITEANVKGEIDWMKSAINRLLRIWIWIPFILVFMYYFSNRFYSFWVGEAIIVPLQISLLMAIFVLFSTFNSIFTHFLNGVGKIKLQMYSAIFSIFLNIPLSIYFAKYTSFGVSGVILATCCSLLVYVILRPIQYWKIVHNKAFNIWDK